MAITKEERYKRARKKVLEIRVEMLTTLGGKCKKCGFADSRALQVDHINGGGNKERMSGRTSGYYFKNVTESFLRGENKYQLLCANCNWVKRHENNECGGKNN